MAIVAQGVDYMMPQGDAFLRGLKQQGFAFVGRYLADPRNRKTLTAEEAKAIEAAGLRIVSVFETTADRAKGGMKSGEEDGQIARSAARAAGQPYGSVIYFAVDFDAGPKDIDPVLAYLHAAERACPGYRPGVYGSYATCEAVASHLGWHHLWQAEAWSGGKVLPVASLHQHATGIIAGVQVDYDFALQADYGSWAPGDIAIPDSVPAWARDAVEMAMATKAIDQPTGDETWYRVLTVLDRLGLFVLD